MAVRTTLAALFSAGFAALPATGWSETRVIDGLTKPLVASAPFCCAVEGSVAEAETIEADGLAIAVPNLPEAGETIPATSAAAVSPDSGLGDVGRMGGATLDGSTSGEPGPAPPTRGSRWLHRISGWLAFGAGAAGQQ